MTCVEQSDAQSDNAAGVIWISGYSAAGKTTIGRKVEALLRSQGLRTLFLDGDDLRSILAHRWTYERQDRIDLAHVYFRLCSHIASQGVTVIISAVAMYDEVRSWLRTYVPRSVEVYLNVPVDERRRRDARTKQLYDKLGDLSNLYDEPTSADLIVNNFGSVTPNDAARKIFRFYCQTTSSQADRGRTTHWANYYLQANVPATPSSFAESVGETLRPPLRILDVGCGNGRDSAFFARAGHIVTGVDSADAAIAVCRKDHSHLDIEFRSGLLPDVAKSLEGAFDVVYCRFVLHAMPVAEEVPLLRAALDLLQPAGRLFIEARSIKDPLARMGKVLSPTERIHGHYRRFIVRDEIEARLRKVGFRVDSIVESDGLAVYGDDNPVVIRIAATVEGPP